MAFETIGGKILLISVFFIGAILYLLFIRHTAKVNRRFIEQVKNGLSKPETKIQTEKMLSDRYKRAIIWVILALAIGLFLPYYLIDELTFGWHSLIITVILFTILGSCMLFMAKGIKNIGKEPVKRETPKNKYAMIRKITIILFILMIPVILLEVLKTPIISLELWIISLLFIFSGIDAILIYKGYLNIWWNPLRMPEDMLKRMGLLQGIFAIFVGLFLLFLAIMSTLIDLSII